MPARKSTTASHSRSDLPRLPRVRYIRLSEGRTIVLDSPPPGYISRRMRFPQNPKPMAFLPLVFLTGTEGFAMFAPYVMLLLAIAYMVRRIRSPQDQPIAIPADL
ncbi:MAG: hypothetical protein QOE14_462 [Humisphaera sp.]|nr:hypothetical protein [Humisphaera sp.]